MGRADRQNKDSEPWNVKINLITTHNSFLAPKTTVTYLYLWVVLDVYFSVQ